jgi:hypothetical protein
VGDFEIKMGATEKKGRHIVGRNEEIRQGNGN